MSKNQLIFTCSHCDAQSPKWSGRCLSCGTWGSLSESLQNNSRSLTPLPSANLDKLINLNTYKAEKEERIKTNISEVDRVFGGGIVPGSMTLLGGEPGIGKSTIVLQIAKSLNQPVLYASGEESASQVKLRVDRLGYQLPNLSFIAENNLEQILSYLRTQKPALAIIDSIQTLYSSEISNETGGVNQIRACTVKLLEVAKQNQIALIIIGHVTKDGVVAGPKTLEHLVDTVIYLEGSSEDNYRILRPIKNRFGAIEEIGVFEMSAKGLLPISNPSNIFYNASNIKQSGTVISVILEGSRPFIVEVQALVTKTHFGYPQRKTSGYDLNRLHLLIAVLTKHAKLPLDSYDIHLNVVGGFKISETSADLAVCMALASSLKNDSSSEVIGAIGEVGLGGEIRPASQQDRRIEELNRIGIKNIVYSNQKNKIHTVRDAIELITDNC